MEPAKSLVELDKELQALCVEQGQWMMIKRVLELSVPVAHLLPEAYKAALQRLKPDGQT